MLIHSYSTDHYYPFAVSLVESFKQAHGEEIPFLIHTKGMTPQRIEDLKGRYKNLTIKNSAVDWEWITKQSGFSKEQLLATIDRVDRKGNRPGVPKGWRNWKHYISVYSRYRDSILDAFDFAGDDEYILHLDIDLYINKDIDAIFNLIKLADISLLLRSHLRAERRKVYGCIMGFTVNDKSRRFMRRVQTHIRAVDFDSMPLGYGQTVFWRAYSDFKNSNIKFAKIPESWVHKGFNNKALILSANNGLAKETTAKRYAYKRKKRRG